MTDLAGKVAIITGGASGIGRAVVQRLCADGAAVLIADLNLPAAQAVAAHAPVPDGGSVPLAFEADVSDEDNVVAMVAEVLDRYGRIDILHNNAAALGRDVIGRDGPVADTEADTWLATLSVNLVGPALAIKHVLPAMKNQRSGSIINTSSILALRGDRSRTAYSASKAGLHALTLSVATQCGRFGIRCNAVAPGTIVGEETMLKLSPEVIDDIVASQLVPRAGRPDDIAAAVAFLASDESGFITGQVLAVDGGYIAHVPSLAPEGRGRVS